MNMTRTTTSIALASALLGATWAANPVHAAEAKPPFKAEAEPLFKYVQLEVDYADWESNRREMTWDGFAWYGGDSEKVWIKTEGEWSDGDLEDAELQLLYSRNIARFWDVQAGIRHDFRPDPTNYLAMSLLGLAPYFFEVDASVFVSDEGDASFRGNAEYDLLLTQALIVTPYAEANIYASDVAGQNVGAGFSDVDAGIRVRYEIRREFSPYIDFNYVGLFGETKSIAEANGKDANDFTVRLGLRFWFN